MQTLSDERIGISGAAGFCQKCAHRTLVHVVGVGSFCAKHYLEYIETGNKPITPALLEHYKALVSGEAHLTKRAPDVCHASSDGVHQWYQGSVWETCAHCGTRR